MMVPESLVGLMKEGSFTLSSAVCKSEGPEAVE